MRRNLARAAARASKARWFDVMTRARWRRPWNGAEGAWSLFRPRGLYAHRSRVRNELPQMLVEVIRHDQRRLVDTHIVRLVLPGELRGVRARDFLTAMHPSLVELGDDLRLRRLSLL